MNNQEELQDKFVKQNQKATENDTQTIIMFYQDQLLQLKQLLYSQTDQLTGLQKENVKLTNQIINLKENNNVLSDTYNDFQTHTMRQVSQLEERLAQMSVEKAEKEMSLDAVNHEMNQIKKQIKEKSQQFEEVENQYLSLKSTMLVKSQSDPGEEVSEEEADRRPSLKKQNSHHLINKKELSAESYSITNEEFQNLKKSNQTFISLVESYKSVVNKNEKFQEKRQQQIKDMMENLPTSAYKILYEDEKNKLSDNKLKVGEIQIWESEVMNLFLNKAKNSQRIHEKIGIYIRFCFPEQFRGKLWKFLVTNNQQLTKRLYYKLLETIPIKNPLITEELLHLISIFFQSYQKDSDLKRTFQFINNFNEQDRLKDDLREMLIIFTIYRPDIGYVQGMTYIAFMFLIRMDKVKAFKCFTNLLFNSKLLNSLYCFKHDHIEAYFQVFNYFLADRLPEVHKHLDQLSIPRQAFLVEWFYTVFARAFNLVISSKVFDNFLYEGDIYVYRLCIAIFSLIEPQLLQCDYEDTLLLIRNCSVQLSELDLFKSIAKVKITKLSFQNRFEKEYEQIKTGCFEGQKML